jgi:hypothetical protein
MGYLEVGSGIIFQKRKFVPRSDNTHTSNKITSIFTSTLQTVFNRHTAINTPSVNTYPPTNTIICSKMSKKGFVKASDMGIDKVIPVSDYSFSFSLSRYSKLDGVRKGFQILMHACPDMMILPADAEEVLLEPLECAGDIPKEVKNWEQYFFNTTTSSRTENGKPYQQIETHATVKCKVLLNRLKGNLEVMNALRKSGIWVKSRPKGGNSTKTCIGFIMGSNPGMSSRTNLEWALEQIIEETVKDHEIYIESRKAKEFNAITKEVFDADVWHVYVHKSEAAQISRMIEKYLAEERQPDLSLRGCKFVPGSRAITSKAVKLYRIQEQNRVTYNMAAIVIKNLYPTFIEYKEDLQGLFAGYETFDDAETTMRDVLDYEITSRMRTIPEYELRVDFVQDIYHRNGKMMVACQSEHVELISTCITEFLEEMREGLSEADFAAVCGIQNYNPYKNPEVECIRNYGEKGMREVAMSTNAPNDIDMELFQKLITDQQLSKFAGPAMPTTYNRAPKATYHARGREPVELDKSTEAAVNFWADFSPPKPRQKTTGKPPAANIVVPSGNHTSNTSIISPTSAFSKQYQELKDITTAQQNTINNMTQTTATLSEEIEALKMAMEKSATESKKLHDAMLTLAASSQNVHEAQTVNQSALTSQSEMLTSHTLLLNKIMGKLDNLPNNKKRHFKALKEQITPLSNDESDLPRGSPPNPAQQDAMDTGGAGD